MNKLPTEIVVNITSQLSFKDKLSLACTCKQQHRTASESTLYNKLVFKDNLAFDQAMQLHNKKSICHLVRHLFIGKLTFNARRVSELSTVFSRVQFMELNGADINTQEFEMVKIWNSVEKIVDSSTDGNSVYGSGIIQLLALLTFNHLDSLELTFTIEKVDSHDRHKTTKALIKALRNTPSLKDLTLTNAVIRIKDAEELHSRVTTLKHLKFNRVCIFQSDDVEYEFDEKETKAHYTPSEILELLSMQDMEAAKNNAINNWISYVGHKYPKLRELDLGLRHDYDLDGKESAKDSLVEALGNMKRLTRYSVDVAPITKATFDVMKANDIQLDHFGFSVYTNDPAQTFAPIQAAQSVSSVSSLAMKCNAGTNISILNDSLMNLYLNLNNLTSLEITCFSNSAPTLIVYVLQNLCMLKSLVLKEIKIPEEENDNLFYNKLSDVHEGRLESVRLAYRDSYTTVSTFKSNQLLAFVVQSSPKLKRFELSASNKFSANGNIYLDFRGNLFLRFVKIDLPNCQYYTFHHQFGKYWKNINDQIMQEGFTRETGGSFSFCVNLAWNTGGNVELQLSESRPTQARHSLLRRSQLFQLADLFHIPT